ncbi:MULTISPECIES: SRPBCC family protein [Actinomadura]|uniref:SRPBCC family protein n=1 Tax=Actinomadura yumaensis TaxID=111807 RepID=A0ABW2CN14_9ACTN|nr:SRPBCC family protein [Actinomadura sp. J1-007]MWK38769.1 SRPBCC family protein [Actinomadura sp. J1-007]
MPHQIEVTATSGATPEALFTHLAVPEAWGAWGRFPTKAVRHRKGDDGRYGVGTVKKIWPAREQTVAYEPYKHFGYIALAGLPVRHYRSDVTLEPRGDGTLITWKATFQPLIPGTAPALKWGLTLMLKAFARWLPAHTEHCPPSCPARRAGEL